MSEKTFEDYAAQAKIDLKIDSVNLDSAAVDTPMLYVKYYEFLTAETRRLDRLMKLEAKMHKARWRFYMGKASAEAYQKEPLNDAIMKTDVDMYLKADDKMIETRDLVKAQRKIVEFLEDCLKQINQRTYLIREAVAFRRLQMGD